MKKLESAQRDALSLILRTMNSTLTYAIEAHATISDTNQSLP